MNETMKKRYQELKSRSSKYAKERKWENNTLLQECLSVLGSNKMVLTMEKQNQILDEFNSELPRLMNSNRKKKRSVASRSIATMDKQANLYYLGWRRFAYNTNRF